MAVYPRRQFPSRVSNCRLTLSCGTGMSGARPGPLVGEIPVGGMDGDIRGAVEGYRDVTLPL